MSILLVEQYLDFCKELADDFAIMNRGAVVVIRAGVGADGRGGQRASHRLALRDASRSA
jgi:ABC-type branched-subunit amino acid transport system ATPase component